MKGDADSQLSFDLTPAQQWGSDAKKRALDELFSNAQRYSSTADYYELLQFIRRFKRYSPFNAMLVHIQKPGARYVLRASEWAEKYNRNILPGAQPLVALQPMSPVMFLFDVADTEGAPLPRSIEAPFEPRSGALTRQLDFTLANCARDGIRVHRVRQGGQRAGSIQVAEYPCANKISFREKRIPINYEMILNSSLSREAQYSTLVHELGHLYCGHLGTSTKKWWPDRRGLDLKAREFEAESVAYLVCQRIGIDSVSEEYLNGYLHEHDQVPEISLERVVVVSGLIEKMGERLLPVRK